MALTCEQIEILCRKHGEFLYHDTKADVVKSILESKTGLRPATEGDNDWPPVLRPRRGCVYFSLPVGELVTSRNPEKVKEFPFRIRLRDIEPKRFLIDEDTVFWTRGSEPKGLPPFSSAFKAIPDELVFKGHMGPAQIKRQVKQSRGEWVEGVGQDTPENTWASAVRGTLAVRGPIDPTLVEVNVASRTVPCSMRVANGPSWKRLT